jgi:hypothetical protein
MTKDQLNDLFFYIHGKLFWKNSGIGRDITKEAGTETKRGYRLICINRKNLRTHRIIYIMHYGEIPENYEIDHIDRNIKNNKIENLRVATRQQNNRNRSYLGCQWSQRHKRWRAKIYVNRKFICLGYHETIIDARATYLRNRKKLFMEFA